jgi:hypothetical protein
MSTVPRVNVDYAVPPVAQTLQQRALLVGVIFGAGSLVGAVFSPAQAMRSYLLGYMWLLGMTLGCLAFLMGHGHPKNS